ncbi:hypothetical protein ACWDO7_12315 [Streptomyces sp. NPDC003656]|uniref:hypothetical protein n=1 Tax=unclassified Streptomyces TaxID=2593676 RepID=UPI0018F6442B|nr:hypothetical protein [Streptomyces sp. DSM 110735]
MAAPAHLSLPAQWKRSPETVSRPGAGPRAFSAEGACVETPLTSEPPLPDAAPLTSEPPLADAAPLTDADCPIADCVGH